MKLTRDHIRSLIKEELKRALIKEDDLSQWGEPSGGGAPASIGPFKEIFQEEGCLRTYGAPSLSPFGRAVPSLLRGLQHSRHPKT